ncbi:hypothetical protein DERP_009187 [Dermatophagoides pteronyssinus]|uniref:Uncharacterized protein n=1 Tax=Dermatophagoides pteronyssinus TaxID=6956 RepID=A0ABQ8JQX0_DERPT|nr:hypothetical protein DERP_009187 [Dermatophagoides pteronyssinus]
MDKIITIESGIIADSAANACDSFIIFSKIIPDVFVVVGDISIIGLSDIIVGVVLIGAIPFSLILVTSVVVVGDISVIGSFDITAVGDVSIIGNPPKTRIWFVIVLIPFLKWYAQNESKPAKKAPIPTEAALLKKDTQE